MSTDVASSPVQGRALNASTAARGLIEIADDVVASLTKTGFGRFGGVVLRLLEYFIEQFGAEVVVRRHLSADGVAVRDEFLWKPGVVPFGEIPWRKRPKHCAPDVRDVCARAGEALNFQDARDQVTGEFVYSENEREHIRQLGSEIIIPVNSTEEGPRDLFVLGHRDPGFASADKVEALKTLRVSIEAIFRLAQYADDVQDKADLLSRVSEVLPAIIEAPSLVHFARTLLAILTCQHGFRFDRAMYFEFPNGGYPGICPMAIGGIGVEWTSARPPDDDPSLRTLADYVKDALRNPVPDGSNKRTPDPLFGVCCQAGRQATYHKGDSPALDYYLAEGVDWQGQRVLKLSSGDPWIQRIQREHPGALVNRHGEYFVFRLQPMTPRGGEYPLGFIVADLPYRPRKHAPGPGSPDLAIAHLVLNLFAGLWRYRESAQTQFGILSALPMLKHEAGHVVHDVDYLRDFLLFPKGQPAFSMPSAAVKDLTEYLAMMGKRGEELGRAKAIVDELVALSPPQMVEDLASWLDGFRLRSERRHNSGPRGEKLRLTIPPVGYTAVAIHRESLESILDCLVDNAVAHSRDTPVTCEISVEFARMPASGNFVEFAVVKLRNSGAPLDMSCVPFLFCERVSTADGGCRGAGLSSARQIARSFGGDVVVWTNDPTTFAVVLKKQPDNITASADAASSGSLEHV